MMKNVPSVVLLGLLLAGCVLPVAFQQDELDQLDTNTFAPLQLQPAYEAFDWRYDIIRQETCETDSDGDSYSEDVPYHPLGFDLGNGLFIDVSDNLALRIDRLLPYSDASLLGLRKITPRNNRRQDTTLYRQNEEHFCIECPNWLGRMTSTCIPLVKSGDTLTRFNNRKAKRVRYQIHADQKSLVYQWQEGYRFILEEEKPGRFRHIRKRGTRERVLENYYIHENEVHIGARLLIRMSADRQQIDVLYKRRKRDRLAYTLRRSNDIIYVITPRRFGFTVQPEEQSVIITDRQQQQFIYEGIWE